MSTVTITAIIILVLVVVFEAVTRKIESGERKTRDLKNKNFIDSITGRIDNLSSKTTYTLNEIKAENKKQIEQIQDEFSKELEKAEDKKDEAKASLNLYHTAVMSLDLNYRKKIQFQIDKIITKPKTPPAINTKGKN